MYEAGDYIYSEDGETELFRLEEETLYKSKKELYIGQAYDLQMERECYLKFTTAVRVEKIKSETCETRKRRDETAWENEWEEARMNLADLKREGEFRFFYPYIEHVYGTFLGKTPDGKDIFGVNIEYIDGEDLPQAKKKLRQEVAAGNISEEEEEQITFRQMMQFLYAMEYYSRYASESYLHRDIKPENIMIQKPAVQPSGKCIEGGGDIKLIDFDFSHISGSKETENLNAALGGTAGYMSPRVRRYMQADEIDDIYSAGRTFCFWLNGRPYFTKEEKDDKTGNYLGMSYSLEEERFTDRYLDPDTRNFKAEYDGLIKIIKRMCCDPGKETPYHTVTEIIEDMQHFLLKYYENDPEAYENCLGDDKILLFQEKRDRNMKKSPVVGSKILRPGEVKNAQVLHEYAMRNIKIDGKLVMVLYNIAGSVYYIPMAGTRFLSGLGGGNKEHRIYNKDIFVNREGIEIQFTIS